jgi:ribosomal-protein-alanine N-acetyltransferase
MTVPADHRIRPAIRPQIRPQIRPMVMADLPRALEIASGLREAPRWSESTWMRVLDPAATPRRIALAAVEPAGGVLLGFAVASLLPSQAELETIAVAGDVQRRGIARALLETLTAELVREGIAELWLEVRASNRAALALYRSAGFVPTGSRPNYYRDPEEDGLLLTLRLRD